MKFVIGVFVLIFLGMLYFSQQNSAKIDTNLSFTPEPSPTPRNSMIDKLIIEDLVIGAGAEVKSGDTIVMHYKGTLLNGTQFDSSYDRGMPFETVIGQGAVIEGWDKGVLGMKVGGKRKLTIPSDMAYGAQGAGEVIPPNSPLVFELELLSVK